MEVLLSDFHVQDRHQKILRRHGFGEIIKIHRRHVFGEVNLAYNNTHCGNREEIKSLCLGF